MIIIIPATSFFGGGGSDNIDNKSVISIIEKEKTSIETADNSESETQCISLDNIDKNGYFLLYDKDLSVQDTADSVQEEMDKNRIIKVSYLDYTILATACEVYPNYHTQAIKAQGVASFTYALKLAMENENQNNPILTVDTKNFTGFASVDQLKAKWGDNFDIYYAKFKTAAEEVLGEFLAYEEKPIAAAYHAFSTGFTEDSGTVWQQSLPYLKAVDSTGDTLAKNFEKIIEFSPEEVKGKITSSYPDLSVPEDLTALICATKKNSSKTVISASLCGKTLSGQELRKLFSLPSASFDYSFDNITNKCIFKTIGYGHCVGMSQNGADFMARQGKTYKDILLHYYTNVKICKAF